jgi:hypothetical protein
MRSTFSTRISRDRSPDLTENNWKSGVMSADAGLRIGGKETSDVLGNAFVLLKENWWRSDNSSARTDRWSGRLAAVVTIRSV